MKRRSFIKTGSAALLAGMVAPRMLMSAVPPALKIGLQLYSLRNEISADLEGSLQKIAAIGYGKLEAAGYANGRFYGMDPRDFRAMVENYGMQLTASHLTFGENETQQVIEAHKAAGVKYLVWPWIGKEDRESIVALENLAVKFNRLGSLCNENGLFFGYHNHDFEFIPVEGRLPYDILLENTDPALVFMEIDLYWITYAGKDPLAYFGKHPGRFRLWHVKDMMAGEEREMTEVGSGIIDYNALFTYSELAGMEEFFVEQDVIRGDAFESVRKSHDYLESILK